MKSVLLEMERLKNPNSGLGQFCLNIGRQFQAMNPSGVQLDFYVPEVQKNIFGEQFSYVNHRARYKFFPMNGGQYNIWHCLHQDSNYLPTNKKTKLILTIHDLNFLEKYNNLAQKSKLKRLQQRVNKAAAITVVSKFTEQIVRENIKLNNAPVYLISNGNSLKVIENSVKPGFINFEKYFFSIGIISAKKNFHVLLPLLQYFKDYHLVIAGNNTSLYAKQIKSMAEKANVLNRLHLIGIVNEGEKYWLYKNCNAFVFPSLHEGFGLPVAEAMSLGKPAFLSNKTSLPEIGGKEAFYWENFDSSHMIDIVEKGFNSFDNDPMKSKRSIDWAKKFSWEKTAEEYLKLYKDI